LENDEAFELSSDSIDDEEILKQKIKELEDIIINLEGEIEDIKQDEIFQTLQNIDDLDEYFEGLKKELIQEKEELELELNVLEKDSIKISEDNEYIKKLKSLQIANFAKILRVCKSFDYEYNKFFNQKGKVYKTLIHSALNEILPFIEDKEFDVVEWGGRYGIVSMIVIDYIVQNQLNTKIKNVYLVDEVDKEIAKVHIELLDKDINVIDDEIPTKTNVINFFCNDEFLKRFDYNIKSKGLFVCLSEESDKYIKKVYDLFREKDVVSNQNTKVGRFYKFEKIFEVR
jgi:hypothetical protein